jgi:hypothetical protein
MVKEGLSPGILAGPLLPRNTQSPSSISRKILNANLPVKVKNLEIEFRKLKKKHFDYKSIKRSSSIYY